MRGGGAHAVVDVGLERAESLGQGAVQNVRIGVSDTSAMLTRVSVEMTRRSGYHLEPSADGQQLTMIIDDHQGEEILDRQDCSLIEGADQPVPGLLSEPFKV